MAYEPYEPIRACNPDVLAPVTPVYAVKPTPSTFSVMVLWLVATLNPESSTAHIDYVVTCGELIEPAE